MINRIYNTVKFFTNNQVQGNVTPTEYNIALHNAILEIYESYFFDLKLFTNQENQGLVTPGYGDVVDRVREKIQYYLTNSQITIDQIPTGFILPSDCRFVDLILKGSLIANEQKPFSLAKNAKHFNTTIRCKDTTPSETYPLALKKGNIYEVSPDTITFVHLYYLRNPLAPNWTYTIPPGSTVELYNPSASGFQNVDMHVSEETDLALRVLKSFGINLKEKDLVEVANRDEVKETLKENLKI